MKNIISFFALFFTGSLLFFGCNQKKNESNHQTHSTEGEHVESLKTIISHAKGFTVTYFPGYKLVTVPQPWKNANRDYQYVLIQKGTEAPKEYPDAKIVEIPIESLVSTSTTHIPLLEMLGVHQKLTGFSNTDFISSPTVRKIIDDGKIKNFGQDRGTNLEILADLEPDIFMTFGSEANAGLFSRIESMGIPVVINADYLETSSLGRAEWIKFASLFFNKEREADSIFNEIEENYLKLQEIVTQNNDKPSVYSGIVYGDIWYMPAGESWAAELFDHAGSNYVWKDSPGQGSLELSFEHVFEKAHDADFWIGVASFASLEEIEKADNRYSNFKAFKTGNVYSYNARMGEKGGNEYMESGYARPDIILADIIKILYPQLLPEHELYYYQKLPVQARDPQL